MKNRFLSLLLFSMLISVTVSAAETEVTAEFSTTNAETRIVTIEIGSENTALTEAISNETASSETNAEIIEIIETEYMDESGLSLWYNAESLKPAEYGGQLCFIPVDEEDALKSSSVLIIVPNEPGETPSPLNEVTGMYPPENVSEMKELTLESGSLIQTVEVTDEDRFNQFFIVSFEDVSANVTAMMSLEEKEFYQAEFCRLAESITFETPAE